MGKLQRLISMKRVQIARKSIMKVMAYQSKKYEILLLIALLLSPLMSQE